MRPKHPLSYEGEPIAVFHDRKSRWFRGLGEGALAGGLMFFLQRMWAGSPKPTVSHDLSFAVLWALWFGWLSYREARRALYLYRDQISEERVSGDRKTIRRDFVGSVTEGRSYRRGMILARERGLVITERGFFPARIVVPETIPDYAAWKERLVTWAESSQEALV